jgi:hypothetical protein
MKRLIVFVLLFSLTSCSLLTKRGRQERAYRNYIRKSSVARVKQQRKFKFRTPQLAIRQDAPSITTQQPESPQSVTSSPASISSAPGTEQPQTPPPPY